MGKGMGKTEVQGFRLGQEGEFSTLNAAGRPVDRLEGKIVYLTKFQSSVYIILLTADGEYRTARIT